jgi:hypothetical protein
MTPGIGTRIAASHPRFGAGTAAWIAASFAACGVESTPVGTGAAGAGAVTVDGPAVPAGQAGGLSGSAGNPQTGPMAGDSPTR